MIGAAIGSISGGVFADYFGRKPSIIAADVVFTLGAILMSQANSIAILMVGRFIVGLGVGVAAMIVPVYLSECAPTHLRG